MIREEPRCKRRPWLSWLIGVAVFLLPVLATAGAATLVGKLFLRPETFPGVLFWWAGLVTLVLVVLALFDRFVSRLLPPAALMRPPRDFSGEDGFTYTVVDSTGRIAIGAVSVTVLALNDAPLARDDSVLVAAGATIARPVLVNDSGPEGEGLSIVSIETMTAAGTVRWTPGSSFILHSAPDPFVEFDAFAYTITGPEGLTATAAVTITAP